jgi:hypothetical protein
MRIRWWCSMVLALLACRPARPDTITTTDNLSVHGSILGVANGELRIKSRFPSEEREIKISLKDIQTIEFDSDDFNKTDPPKIMGFERAGSQIAGDVIVLRDGARKACSLISIDAGVIHCAPGDKSYAKSDVIRIVLGSR